MKRHLELPPSQRPYARPILPDDVNDKPRPTVSKPAGLRTVAVDSTFQLCPVAGTLASTTHWQAPEPGLYLVTVTVTKLPTTETPNERPSA